MAYIRKNVNMLLMILVLVVLLSLVLLTTVYQTTYRNLSESYDTASEELAMVSQNFTSKLDELRQTTSELKIRSTDKEKLDELYTKLTAERNKLDTELKATQENLADTTVLLRTTEDELDDANYKNLKQQEEIAMLDSAVINQKKKIDSLRQEVCDLNKQIDPEYQC